VPLDVHTSNRARDDLLGIWLYTAERWGSEQANAYLDRLDAGIARLRDNPLAGTDFSSLREGYRRFAVERHRIFYVVSDERIEIVRILHERMDVEPHLRPEPGARSSP
jgi:toxin ParE1/3/4